MTSASNAPSLIEYVGAALGGRCATGEERGQGTRVHAHTDVDGLKSNQYVMRAAICGARAGPRSVGWCYRSTPVTCPRCVHLLMKEFYARA